MIFKNIIHKLLEIENLVFIKILFNFFVWKLRYRVFLPLGTLLDHMFGDVLSLYP